MKRLMLVTLCLVALLVGCARGTSTETPVPFDGTPGAAPPTPTLNPVDPVVTDEDLVFPEINPLAGTEEPGSVASEPDISEGRFTNLRFATSADGAPQVDFPEGTEEIYAIWDYDGMEDGDTMERVWYLNDEQYVNPTEAWDFLKYGFSGTMRDVYLYDYEDGIDPGNWRVELYLNGELQASEAFTVGGP